MKELTAGAEIYFLPMPWSAHTLIMWYYKQHFPIWNTKALGVYFLLLWNLRLPIDIAILQLSNCWALFFFSPEYSANSQRLNRICFWINNFNTNRNLSSSWEKTSWFVEVQAECRTRLQLQKHYSIWWELQTKQDRLGRLDMTPPDSLPDLYSFLEPVWDQMFLSSWNFWRSVFSIPLSS